VLRRAQRESELGPLMKIEGHVDRLDIFGIHGWATDQDQPNRPLSVQIVNNGKPVATVPARVFRPDLAARGVGDGRHAFWFNPFERLQYGENALAVRVTGIGQLLPGAARVIYFDSLQLARFAASNESPEDVWWPGIQPRALTADGALTSDAFIDEVARRLPDWSAEHKVLGLGPDSARLVKPMSERGHAYRQFVGLEPSPESVHQLQSTLANARTRFVPVDAASEALESDFDVLLCSGGLDGVHPNFLATLQKLQRHLVVNAQVCLDFIQLDPEMLISGGGFAGPPKARKFLRVYSRADLESLLPALGLEIAGITSLAGTSSGQPAHRIFVWARNLGPKSSIAVTSAGTLVTDQAAGEVVPPVVAASSDASEAPLPWSSAELPQWRSRAWLALYRLRHSSQLAPLVNRMQTRGSYRAAKRLLAAILRRSR